MKKENIRMCIVISVIIAVCFTYVAYENDLNDNIKYSNDNVNYSDLISKNKVFEVLSKKSKKTDKSTLSDCDRFINAFKGVEELKVYKGKVKVEANTNIYSYIDKYNKENGLKEKSNYIYKSEVFKEIYEKNKYYNEEELELYLILYNNSNNTYLCVEDIKKFVDDSDIEKFGMIDSYVDWYSKEGKEVYKSYCDYYKTVSDQYENKDFALISMENKKEVLKRFFEEVNVYDIVKEKDRKNIYWK